MFNNNLINDSIDAIVNDASSYTSIDDIDCNTKKQKKRTRTPQSSNMYKDVFNSSRFVQSAKHFLARF